jgi:hypothetical protein
VSNGTVIARGGLELRKSPKTGGVIKSLRRSSKVEILGQETWLRVRTRDGDEGYVLADFIEIAPEDLFPSPEAGLAAVEALAAAAEIAAAPRARAEPGGAVEPMAGAPAVEPFAPAVPTPSCDLRLYRNTRFIGKELRADFDFFPCLDRLNSIAVACDVEIYVTSSAREPGRTVRGAIVPPASRSNHLVGHALDMNIKSVSGFFNSQALKRSNLPNLPGEIREFIAAVRADADLRWGGDFNPEDPVHIDDGLNTRDGALWDSKLASR